MHATDQLDDGISIHRVLTTLRRHGLLIAATALILAGLVFGYSSSQEKQYATSASLLFRDPGFDQRLFGSQFLNRSPDPDRDAATNLALVSQRGVARAAAKALGPEWTEAMVRARVQESSVSRSDLVAITATDPSPKVAARVANVFAQEFVRLRKQADQQQIRGAQALVQQQLRDIAPADRQGELAVSLARRGQELKILASLQTGKAEVVQAAQVPESPSAPRVKRNTVLGLVIGLGLGIALALLTGKLDRRVREPEEVEGLLERPILGTIPDFGSIGTSVAVGGQRATVAVDAFQTLRANLRFFNPRGEVQTLLVTSAGPGDGKSVVSRNLAFAAAEAGLRTLLIEADLRRPTLAKALAIPEAVGLSTLLVRQCTLAEAVQEIPLARLTQATADGTVDELHVVVAGTLPPNPADLLESTEMEELLSQCEREYDLVIIDTAPVLVVPDAVALFKRRIGVLIVARMGRTDRQSLSRLQKYLLLLEAPVLGVVANSIKISSGYRYGYGYGYGSDAASKGQEDPAGVASNGHDGAAAVSTERDATTAEAPR